MVSPTDTAPLVMTVALIPARCLSAWRAPGPKNSFIRSHGAQSRHTSSSASPRVKRAPCWRGSSEVYDNVASGSDPIDRIDTMFCRRFGEFTGADDRYGSMFAGVPVGRNADPGYELDRLMTNEISAVVRRSRDGEDRSRAHGSTVPTIASDGVPGWKTELGAYLDDLIVRLPFPGFTRR